LTLGEEPLNLGMTRYIYIKDSSPLFQVGYCLPRSCLYCRLSLCSCVNEAPLNYSA